MIGRTLKLLRKRYGYTQDDLAKKIGTAPSTISMYEQEKREPDLDTINKIAKLFGVSIDYLFGNEVSDLLPMNIRPIQTKKIPLLGNIACGEPIYASEEFEAMVESGNDIDADFCLRATGDSMIGARIYDGDIVFIKKQDLVDNGDIAAVLIGDEATLKRIQYNREENELLLFAENPKYKTMRFSGSELDQIRILGKAVAFQGIVV